MSVVPVVFDGVMYPKGKAAGDKPVPCTFVGNAYRSDLSVGGGPIIPDKPPETGGGGRPTFPIWGPPGSDFPGLPGYPPVAGHPLPDPPPPVDPDNPQPIRNWEAKAAWTPTTGWIVVLVPGEGTLVPTPSKK